MSDAVQTINHLNSTSSIDSQKNALTGLEIVVGVNKLPKRLYLLLDAEGNDVTDGEPVSHSELIDIIIESKIYYRIREAVASICGCSCDECYDDEVRGLAEEIAIEEGYRIIEVLK